MNEEPLTPELEKSSTGLDANVAGMVAYILGWVTGLVFLVIEKESRFVKFHAWQSLLTSIAFAVIYWVVALILPWQIQWLITIPLWLLIFGLFIFMMIKAYNRERFKLPIVGDIAWKQAYGDGL